MRLSFPLEMPYYQPADDLPAPLPLIEEIRASQHSFHTRRASRHIVRVGDHYVVKYGGDVDLIEGENMLFVKQNCNIPIPEVYALFHDEETQSNYIIMQFVSGESLASLWETFDDVSKGAITQELRKTFDELRQIIPQHNYYGKLGQRAYFDEIFMSLDPETYQRICGPFATEGEMVDAIAHRYLCESLYPQRGEYLRRILPQVLHSGKPVFTHGDFQRKNVIVSGSVPFIIDWEAAAFYPQYYEYYTAMVAFGHYQDDWHAWVSKVLDEYVIELGWLDTIRRELY